MFTPSGSILAILGGAGKAGRPLVAAALTAGYQVRLLLRHPETFPLRHKQLHLIQGDARDPTALRHLLRGSSSLLSTLGNPREESTPMLSTVTEHLLRLLPAAAIQRYLTVTSLYTTAQAQLDSATSQAAAYMQAHYAPFMQDRQRELDLLRHSTLAWTALRLPYLLEGPTAGPVAARLDYLPGPTLAVVDLARFLLALLDNGHFSQQAPFVANGAAPT